MTVIYDHQGIRLLHGDAFTPSTAEWLDADVLVTDPPYGIAWKQDGLSGIRETRRHAHRPGAPNSITNDHDLAARDEALRLWGDRPAIVFGSWRRERPPKVTHRMIWHKAGRFAGVAPAAVYPNDEEIYLLGGGWTPRRLDPGQPGGYRNAPCPTVLTTSENRALEPNKHGHPTPKPVMLMEQLLLLCPDDWVIADPFAGSGATLAAARNLRRRAVGVEMDAKFCTAAVARLGQEVLF